jgi:cellulose synthase/poly-beta-1,6-N-acetylglucosamine synthase-like glycosyltransferase
MSETPCDPLELAHRRPEWSAREPLTRVQRILLLVGAVAAIAWVALSPASAARIAVLLCTIFYLAATVYKLALIRAGEHSDAMYHFGPAELAARNVRPWPMYSILVPLYREPETLRRIVQELREMDYPADRKDVQLLLEADDASTLEAARTLDLPPGFRITVVPHSFPRTKPKACNVGLHQARGDYLVVYDAEDRPEPDQLKKAVMAFEASPPRVVCVQSCLNYYNPEQNLLTRWFAAEYAAWFDMQLPGLAALHAVIPLGGTSNHFITAVLRSLHGWDAYNVTEDCDLGVRLSRTGHETRMVATTTWEEACSSFRFWIRQRTRWQKGYIQTYCVHMRCPLRLLRELGPIGFLHFQLLVGGAVFSSLINPVFWAMALLWFALRPAALSALFPGPVFAAGALCLFAGNFIFVYCNLLGCYQRRYDRLMAANLLTPVYWLMMSYSGWRALLQFFRDPFQWEKTQHGLDQAHAR